IDDVPKDHVIFISSPHGVFNAVYGGLMSTRAKYLEAMGTVVDGTFRELQEHRDLKFPVNVPVKLQDPALDVTINPGDIIFGDLNGVVCVPQNLVAKVVELLPRQVEADEKMARDITQGKTFKAARDEYR
ncbi:hypothetical protein FGRMN_5729, partial [Fusarium graminum]